MSAIAVVRAQRAITETGIGFASGEVVRDPSCHSRRSHRQDDKGVPDAQLARIVRWVLVSSLLVIALSPSAFAQDATPTPTPIMMPNIPQIQLQPVPAYGPAPLTVGFFVTSVNPESAPIASYLWNFGDGQVSMLPPTALFHTYATPGSYVVNVTTTDTDGHQAASFAGVVVTQPAVQQPAAP